MIEYIRRQDIDLEKYDRCIENSINSRIYAFSWYLEIVADNWDVLVLGDYEAVMPLPWRSKYFIKYVYPPCWTQQLGVFSSKEINEALVRKFIKHIPNKFRKVTIQFNSGNPISIKKVEKRVNYILDLNKSYEELLKRYRYERRRIVRNRKDVVISYHRSNNADEIMGIFMESKEGKVNISNNNYIKLRKLFIKNNVPVSIEIVSCEDTANNLIGGACFLVSNKRLIYLFSSVNIEGRNNHAMTFIIDSIIKKYSSSKMILDFEGSMIPGISFFIKSFGSKIEGYSYYQKSFSLI